MDWTDVMAPVLDVFETLAVEAYEGLPEEFRALCGDIRFLVADFPDDDVIQEMGLDSPFDILGLFEGRGLGDLATPVTGEMPNRILLYRRPILDYWAENEETLAWDDPSVGVEWPLVNGEPPRRSAKDAAGVSLADARSF